MEWNGMEWNGMEWNSTRKLESNQMPIQIQYMYSNVIDIDNTYIVLSMDGKNATETRQPSPTVIEQNRTEHNPHRKQKPSTCEMTYHNLVHHADVHNRYSTTVCGSINHRVYYTNLLLRERTDYVYRWYNYYYYYYYHYSYY